MINISGYAESNYNMYCNMYIHFELRTTEFNVLEFKLTIDDLYNKILIIEVSINRNNLSNGYIV